MSLTAQQPEVNIVRTAIEALAGVLGGTQSLHTNSMDEVLALPTEKAARIALRTQQVIAHETGVANVSDPLGGSWFVESLTDEIERQAEAVFARLDEWGEGSMLEGVLHGIEHNWFQGEIADAAYVFQRKVASGRRIVVGVNDFTEGSDEPAPPTLQIGHEVEEAQRKRLAAVRQRRDQAQVDATLAAVARRRRRRRGEPHARHPRRRARLRHGGRDRGRPRFGVRPVGREPGRLIASGPMASFVVRPGGPLHGTARAGGAKNSALKLMAACLLAAGRHVLAGVPRIVDVEIMAEVLSAIGAQVARGPDRADGTPADLVIDTPVTLVPEAPYELVEKMRASVVVLGPLLARSGRASVSLPGGDDFGNRPIDIHLHGLSMLGASFQTVHGNIEGSVPGWPVGRLVGQRIVFEYPSHTATDNVLMAAVLAKGTTVIENAAREPEVSDLAALLTAMGAHISGAGTSHIEVEGVDELHPARPPGVIPDRVVAATYMAATALAGGEVVIEDARADHMDMVLRKMGEIGVTVTQAPEGMRATSSGRLHSVDMATLPYPGVATDYKPLLVTMLSVADGVGIVTENLFSGRFRYVDELRRMGADIRTEGHHAVVRGVPRLSGAPVRATDVRAGAALVLAGMMAEGETVVSDAQHIDRGYEDLAVTLGSLGADVTRT